MSTSKASLWAGRVLTGLSAFGLISSGAMKLSGGAEMMKNWTDIGFPASSLTPVGAVEITIAIMTLIPQLSALGLILVAAYLGGAVAIHLQMGQPLYAPIILAVLAWGGLFLRDARVRALIPLRRPE